MTLAVLKASQCKRHPPRTRFQFLTRFERIRCIGGLLYSQLVYLSICLLINSIRLLLVADIVVLAIIVAICRLLYCQTTLNCAQLLKESNNRGNK